jgi:hypothetical protein
MRAALIVLLLALPPPASNPSRCRVSTASACAAPGTRQTLPAGPIGTQVAPFLNPNRKLRT